MIIVVSDTHLGDPASNREGFNNFIDTYIEPNSKDISHIILLGDILDLWRRNTSNVILDNLEILNKICSIGAKVVYVVGNHDFLMAEIGLGQHGVEIQDTQTCNPVNMTIATSHILQSGDTTFKFIHGHQINYWFVLPFYEAFCRAMCNVNSHQRGLEDVWNVIDKFSENLAPYVIDKLQNLSYEIRSQIEQNLAGPLEGNTISMEEGILKEYELLSDLTEIDFAALRGQNRELIEGLRQEVEELVRNIPNSFTKKGRVVDLIEAKKNGSVESIASQFLLLWKDIYHWIASSREKTIEHYRLAQRARRIAAIFSTGLRANEFLIHGHGHEPYVDIENRLADAGCWLRDKGSFLVIEDGLVRVTDW